jgi:hypothetical protein
LILASVLSCAMCVRGTVSQSDVLEQQ